MLILCKRQGRRNWQLLCTRWEQSYLLCAGPGQGSNVCLKNGVIVSLPPSVSAWVLLVQYSTLVSLLREICHYLHQPSTWGNQRGELTNSVSSKFLAPLPGTQTATSRWVPTIAKLRSRCRTPVYKIGELHTIFYLCFLVLLVYLSVFILCLIPKYQKKVIFLSVVLSV